MRREQDRSQAANIPARRELAGGLRQRLVLKVTYCVECDQIKYIQSKPVLGACGHVDHPTALLNSTVCTRTGVVGVVAHH